MHKHLYEYLNHCLINLIADKNKYIFKQRHVGSDATQTLQSN